MKPLIPYQVVSTYRRLKDEYRAIPDGELDKVCPSKITVDARPGFNKGQWQLPLTAMAAKLSDGTAGVKAVLLNENTGDMTAYTSVFYTDGSSKVVNSIELTRYRCALMAALATDGRVNLQKGSKVGFIGSGRINLYTAKVFNILFGVEDFVIAGSKDHPMKNFEEFSQLGFTRVDCRANQFRFLRTCDVVISATTATAEAEIIEFDKLSGPSLFIAQDSGFIFGESFRHNCNSFSDSPSQLFNHWHNEFPWDITLKTGSLPVADLNATGCDGRPSAVYLYGIALADVVVAAEAWE